MGPEVLAAGALFGGSSSLIVGLVARVVGLTINWHLCRVWIARLILPAAVALASIGLPLTAVVALSHALTAGSAPHRPGEGLLRRFCHRFASLHPRLASVGGGTTVVVQAGAIGADALTVKLSLVSKT